MKISIEGDDGDNGRPVGAIRTPNGFRVVFDAGLAVPPGRTNRGSMSGEAGAFAAIGGTEEARPYGSHWSIGIRLAKEFR